MGLGGGGGEEMKQLGQNEYVNSQLSVDCFEGFREM